MRDQQLAELLRELARDDAAITPPSSLEHRTRTAFDAWRADAPSRPVGRRWPSATVAGLAVAASVLAVVMVSQRPGVGRDAPGLPTAADLPPRPVMRGDAAATPGGRVPVDRNAGDVGDSAAAGVPPAAMPRHPRVPRPYPRPPTATRHVETLRFTPLGPGVEDDLRESFHLSHVQVPRRILVDIGVLAEGRPDDETIDADVMFGEDGMAKAIRLTPAARRVP